MRNPLKMDYKQGVIVVNFNECELLWKPGAIDHEMSAELLMKVREFLYPHRSGGLFRSIENL